MINLLRFLHKHSFVLLFLLLEALAVYMLTKSSNYHRSVVINTTNNFAGDIFTVSDNVSAYFSLKQTNRQLADENAALRNKIAYLSMLNDTIYQSRPDTIYHYIAARVVSNTLNRRNNYIIIDKGSADGVQTDMGIVSPDGIAGMIIGVSEHYATAMSLLHKYATISVRFKSNDQLANLSWYGGDYRYGTIEQIPTHIILNQGDTVVTSGHSFLFPDGMLVGTIDEAYVSDGSDLNSARILLATDFNKLKQVYVVENQKRIELDSLINLHTNE